MSHLPAYVQQSQAAGGNGPYGGIGGGSSSQSQILYSGRAVNVPSIPGAVSSSSPNPPIVFVDVPVPLHILQQQSPLASHIPIPWTPSAYAAQKTTVIPIPLQDEPKRFVAKDQRKIEAKPKVSSKVEPKIEGKDASDESSKDSTTKAYSNDVIFFVNGTKYVLNNPNPLMTLNDFLRNTPGLQGTKRMCNQGGCGVCTVILNYTDALGRGRSVSVNSCLRPIATVDGMSITTVEGVGNTVTGLDPVQNSLVTHNATQCGMCSPGFVMQMTDLITNNPAPTPEDVESHFDGNICRCTGYRPILDAFQTFAKSSDSENCNGKGCSKDIEDLSCCKKMASKVKPEPPRPLALYKAGSSSEPVWAHPINLQSLYSLIQTYPSANKKLVVGNTSVGIWPDVDVQLYIDVRNIPDLLVENYDPKSGITVGAAVPIAQFIKLVTSAVNSGGSTKNYASVLTHLNRIASHQIRNAGCVAGNLMLTYLHANFPSDFMICSIAIGATITYTDPLVNGTPSYTIPVEQIYSVNMTNKVIQSIFWPIGQSNQVVSTYKVALRPRFSHAIVNAGFRVVLDPKTMVVVGTPTLAYGGIVSQTVRATNTEKWMVGQVWTSSSFLQNALSSLQSELIPDPSMGRTQYRSNLINSYFYKFYLNVIDQIQPGTLPSDLFSAARPYVRPVSYGTATYDEDPLDYLLPQFVPKLEGKLQVTGEAQYHSDMELPRDTLFASVVMSTEGNADLVSIDASAALAIPGVVAVLTAKDIPGLNRCDTALGLDKKYWEPILAKDHVDYAGQAIALVLAVSSTIADNATSAVNVTYSNIQQPIITIDDAIQQNSTFDGVGPIGPVVQGDVDQGLQTAPNVVSGQVSLHDCYHFHMETQVCVAHPKEDQQFELFLSTQWSSVTQFLVAKMLKLPAHNITVNVKRIGGSYGAKITRANQIGCLAALASYCSRKSVVLQLPLQTNMMMVGKRHPYMCDYSVGFTNDGIITTFDAKVYAGAGFTLDGTDSCLLAVIMSIDNCYKFQNFRAEGFVLRTNLACNTYMRAPGFFQGIFFADQVFEHVAQVLNVNPDDLKRKNFYQKGDVTPYNESLDYWSMGAIWEKLKLYADYEARYKLIENYNANNRYTKRGISMVPCKYGMTLAQDPFGSLVSILADGTVVVSHGGTEVGQGINTKVAQAVARVLGVDVSLIRIACHSTITTANSSATGGSVTSELCVKSVMHAAGKVRRRMDPIEQLLNNQLGIDVPWNALVEACITNGVNLNANASEWEVSHKKNPMKYNSYSAACAEVQVDTLTGEVTVLRTDIVFDCGTSLNPILDMGQVQGGFVQGLGYYLQEELTYDSTTGQVTSNDTWEYKPPLAFDIPIDFRCHLERNAPNPLGVLGSKASGEPPTVLSSVIFWSVQHAILSAKNDPQLISSLKMKKKEESQSNEKIVSESVFIMDTPASVDAVQLACEVDPAKFTY